jgi:small subunit ribosomal protein S8
MTDPIADMITRIKNAVMAEHEELILPHSKMKEAIAKILKESNYIKDYQVVEKKPQSDIKITLNYINGVSAISGVKRVSKPGRRVHLPVDQIPRTLNGYGLTIISSNKGVIDDKTARKQNLGGEVLCQIW